MESKEQYALPVYVFNKIDNTPNSEIQFKITDQLFLEILLMKIRSKTISHSIFIKKKYYQNEKKLLRDIHKLKNMISENNILKLENNKKN